MGLMRPPMPLIRRSHFTSKSIVRRRSLLTLAIETSCDDTGVAILEKRTNNSATLHFHEKITSDNRQYKGVYPIVAHESHQRQLASLVNRALQSLPPLPEPACHSKAVFVKTSHGGEFRQKPDFITVTRGPGMRAGLITGVDTGKGLAVAWQIPFLGVNHMQAHALTPRLISALGNPKIESPNPIDVEPPFPFLSLLVSGGNTLLVHSKGLCNHKILAQTTDLAIGDMLDKSARDILPSAVLSTSPDVSYGPILESYAFMSEDIMSDSVHDPLGEGRPLTNLSIPRAPTALVSRPLNWAMTLPMSNGRSGTKDVLEKKFSFSGIGSCVKSIMTQNPNMEDWERRILARETMRVAFEHLASRVLMALTKQSINEVTALVVSGGVASNRYLKQIIRAILDKNGYDSLPLCFPPQEFCTDNAAMIAWTGIEMWEAGYRTDLEAMAMRDWSIDPESTHPIGILEASGWRQDAD